MPLHRLFPSIVFVFAIVLLYFKSCICLEAVIFNGSGGISFTLLKAVDYSFLD